MEFYAADLTFYCDDENINIVKYIIAWPIIVIFILVIPFVLFLKLREIKNAKENIINISKYG